MRYLLLALLVFSTTSAFAQNKDPSTGAPIYTEWQLAEYSAHTKKCFLSQPGKLQHELALNVTIGSDGMVVGEPEVLSPIDSGDFRADVEIARNKLRQCQPYIVDPFKRVRRGFTQVFKFEREEPNQSMSAAIKATFEKCWKRPRIGPTIWVSLLYKPDGTMKSPPSLINPEKTEEYLRAASDLLRQIEKCPPVQFPKEINVDPHRSINWSFQSYEGVNRSKSKL